MANNSEYLKRHLMGRGITEKRKKQKIWTVWLTWFCFMGLITMAFINLGLHVMGFAVVGIISWVIAFVIVKIRKWQNDR